jgi:hypothetical protein
MSATLHRTREELEAGLHEIFRAPRDAGTLELIVRRPAVGQREILDEAQLDPGTGLVGDNWVRAAAGQRPMARASRNAVERDERARRGAAGTAARAMALAGDQLYVDLDLGTENLPPGTRLTLGSAVIEITAVPHTGCSKFAQRFRPAGRRVRQFADRKQFRFRGLNAKVVQGGAVRTGDPVRKI